MCETAGLSRAQGADLEKQAEADPKTGRRWAHQEADRKA